MQSRRTALFRIFSKRTNFALNCEVFDHCESKTVEPKQRERVKLSCHSSIDEAWQCSPIPCIPGSEVAVNFAPVSTELGFETFVLRYRLQALT